MPSSFTAAAPHLQLLLNTVPLHNTTSFGGFAGRFSAFQKGAVRFNVCHLSSLGIYKLQMRE